LASKEMDTQTVAINTQSSKVACHTCYRLLFKHLSVCFESFNFCQETCRSQFLESEQTLCTEPTCSKKLLKMRGFVLSDQFYCSEDCCPNYNQLFSRLLEPEPEPEPEKVKERGPSEEPLDSARC